MSSASVFSAYWGWDTFVQDLGLKPSSILASKPRGTGWTHSFRSGGAFTLPNLTLTSPPLPSFWAPWDLEGVGSSNLSCYLLNAGLGQYHHHTPVITQSWPSEASCPQAGPADLRLLTLPIALRVHSSPAGICTTNKTNISREE